MMKGLVTDGSGNLWLENNIPIPELGPYDSLAKNIACGICNGTDLKLVEGNVRYFSTYPAVIGHEAVGKVVMTGSKVKNFKEGDLVLRSGATSSFSTLHSLWGGFAEYGVVTDFKAMIENGVEITNPAAITQQIVPTDINPVLAVMMITLKEVQSAIERLGFEKGMNVAIAGCGPVGLSMVRLLRLAGAGKIIVSGHHNDRIEKAGILGADILINSKNSIVTPTIIIVFFKETKNSLSSNNRI
jgi:threonine dehydrogenase-like Zn-dependent dehydrogenase